MAAKKHAALLKEFVRVLQGNSYRLMAQALNSTTEAKREHYAAYADVLAGVAHYADARYITLPDDLTPLFNELQMFARNREASILAMSGGGALRSGARAGVRNISRNLEVALEVLTGKRKKATWITPEQTSVSVAGLKSKGKQVDDKQLMDSFAGAINDALEAGPSRRSRRRDTTEPLRAPTSISTVKLKVLEGRKVKAHETVEASANKIASALRRILGGTYFEMKPIASDLLTSRSEGLKVDGISYRAILG